LHVTHALLSGERRRADASHRPAHRDRRGRRAGRAGVQQRAEPQQHTPASVSHPAATHSPVPSPSQPASPAAAPSTFGYLPLYPFASRSAARAWQAAYAAGGHQPWQLDARLTALSFTQGYLGFRGIDRAPVQAASGTNARVTVAFRLPNGHVSAAAVIHLVRYGNGANTPWEVVGTNDTTLTLDLPSYGSTVTCPCGSAGRSPGSMRTCGQRCTGWQRRYRSAVTAAGRPVARPVRGH